MPKKPDSTASVVCTLTPGRLADRAGELSTLRAAYLGAEKGENGYTLRFDGDDAFEAVGAFVARERWCCSFARYTLETAPPYEETRLTIDGPEGTKTVFGEGLLELLQTG